MSSTASESPASTAPSASGFFDYSAKEAFVVGAVTAIVQFCTAFAYGGVGTSDFAIFQRSTTRFLDGVRMYSSAEVDFTPPLFHALLLPFAHLNTTLACCLWTAANVCLAAVLVRTVLRAVPAAWPKRWVVAAVVINAAGVQMTLRLGQVSWIVALLVTHAWLAGRSSRPYASGILAGVAIALKPFLIVAIPVFLVRRQWTRLAATVVSVAVCGAGARSGSRGHGDVGKDVPGDARVRRVKRRRRGVAPSPRHRDRGVSRRLGLLRADAALSRV